MITFDIVTIIIIRLVSEQNFDFIMCNSIQFTHVFYDID